MSKFTVFKFELKKFYYNKYFMIVSIAVLLISIASVGILYAFQDVSGSKNQVKDLDKQLELYGQNIQINIKNIEEGNFSTAMKEVLVKKNQKFQFFIDTNTTEYDYLDITEPYNKYEKAMGIGFMFYMLQVGSILVLVFTIVFSSYVFNIDYSGMKIKNIFAGQVSRKSIFIQRWALIMTAICLLFVVFFIVPVVYGAFSSVKSFLNYQ